MTSCNFVTGKARDGKDVLCGRVAQEASAFCPRHTFLHNVKLQEQNEKDQKRAVTKRAAHAGPASTREEMLRRGYQFRGTRECSGCKEHIEWWMTPNGRMAPYNPMPELTSHATSHFATCNRAVSFRRVS